MSLDIFSAFDPIMTRSMNITPLWMSISMTFLILTIPMTFWAYNSRLISFPSPLISTMMQQLMRTSMKSMKMTSLIISSLFTSLIMINLLGMLPYLFSLSSHLLFTLSLGLPLWLMMIISSMLTSPKQFLAHLLPDGAPTWLNPFLILVETISILVRPLTLSFRLAANMTAGHIVLSLLGLYGSKMMMYSNSVLLLTLMMSFYIMFEFAICLIQAYIFCLLLSLYSNDHSE